MIQITYHRDGRSHNGHNAWNANPEPISNSWFGYGPAVTLATPLLESTVLEIWDETRASAFRVVEQCIANGHSGMERDSFAFPQAQKTWWSVDVRAVAANSLWDRLARMDAGMAVRDRLAPGHKAVKDTFRETFNDLD